MHSREGAAKPQVTFVVTVNNREVFENNFLSSPCFAGDHGFEIIVQEKFVSATKAYNDALRRSSNDLIVFCHQDMYFPEAWIEDLKRSLDYLAVHDPNWGVLGCAGITVDRKYWGYLYSSGLGICGAPLERPQPIQTLDEIVLILRKSSEIKFDELLPSFHLYGTDICLTAAKRGMTSYVISAFCIHNTHQIFVLSPEFYECCEYVRHAWNDSLPIQTTCIRITKSNLPIYLRKLRELHLRYIRRKEFGALRAPNVQELLQLSKQHL